MINVPEDSTCDVCGSAITLAHEVAEAPDGEPYIICSQDCADKAEVAAQIMYEHWKEQGYEHE